MKQDLIRVLAITEEEIQWRAALKMQSLLHNFGAFNITTLGQLLHMVWLELLLLTWVCHIVLKWW